MGGRRREGRKWDSLGGGNWKKMRKSLQHCVIFCNRNSTKRGVPLRKAPEHRSK